LQNGKFIMVWFGDNTLDSSGYGVYGQIFYENGTKYGAEFKINTYTSGNQWSSSVHALQDGKFVAIWGSDNNQDSSGYGVYGQIYTTDGMPFGQEFQINTHTAGDQYPRQGGYSHKNVVNLLDDKFVVVWDSDGQDGDGHGVYAQIFSCNQTNIAPTLTITFLISPKGKSSPSQQHSLALMIQILMRLMLRILFLSFNMVNLNL